MCKPLINFVCTATLEQLKRKKPVSLGAPWPTWTLHLASVRKVQAMGKLGVEGSRITLKKEHVMGETVRRKPGFVFVLPLVVEQNVNQKPEIDLANMPKTVSLEQVTNLMRELKKQDVCDMEVDLAEVMWQEPDAKIWNALAHALETMAECLPAEEEGEEDVNMRGDGRRDESHSEQAPMEDDEQRDGSVPEQEAHSKQDLERVRKALEKFHTNLGHPGVKEMVRVSKHGRASELAIQEARRRHCDVCAENVQPKLPRPATPRQVLDFNEPAGLDILSLTQWESVAKSVKMP